jgi:integrase
MRVFVGMRSSGSSGRTWSSTARQMKVLGKGAKLRLVPLHPVLQDVLAELPPVSRHVVTSAWKERVSAFTFNRKLRDLLERAQVDGGRRLAHKFRKTLATSLFENGAQERVIDRIFGWAPTTVRDRHYTRVADILMQRAILVAYEDDPLSAPRRPLVGRRQTRDSETVDAGAGLVR